MRVGKTFVNMGPLPGINMLTLDVSAYITLFLSRAAEICYQFRADPFLSIASMAGSGNHVV